MSLIVKTNLSMKSCQEAVGKIEDIVERRKNYSYGTRVINCMEHSNLDIDKRPATCEHCQTDIGNFIRYVVAVNAFINGLLDDVEEAITEEMIGPTLSKQDELYGKYIQKMKDGYKLINYLDFDTWYLQKETNGAGTPISKKMANRLIKHPAVKGKKGWCKMIYTYKHDYESPWEG